MLHASVGKHFAVRNHLEPFLFPGKHVFNVYLTIIN